MELLDAANPLAWGRRAQALLVGYWLLQTARIAAENPDVSLAIVIPSVAVGSWVLLTLLRIGYHTLTNRRSAPGGVDE